MSETLARIIFYGGFVLLIVLCAGIQLWYGSYRARRKQRNAADGDQPMLGDFEDPRYPKHL